MEEVDCPYSINWKKCRQICLYLSIALIEQNVDEYASIFFTFSQIKQFATQKQFRKFNRQYLKNQQTVLSSPDSPCQTVLKSSKSMPDSFEFFRLFIHPWLLTKKTSCLCKISSCPWLRHSHKIRAKDGRVANKLSATLWYPSSLFHQFKTWVTHWPM